ncbi:MAG: hypothetical protein ABSH08_07390 [Tepidisphaeraceae bacterium]|jgi:hypothetical protein
MKHGDESIADETTMTEITVHPDGRVCIFGTSRQILDVLIGLNPHSSKLNRLLGQVRRIESAQGEAREVDVNLTSMGSD